MRVHLMYMNLITSPCVMHLNTSYSLNVNIYQCVYINVYVCIYIQKEDDADTRVDMYL